MKTHSGELDKLPKNYALLQFVTEDFNDDFIDKDLIIYPDSANCPLHHYPYTRYLQSKSNGV